MMKMEPNKIKIANGRRILKLLLYAHLLSSTWSFTTICCQPLSVKRLHATEQASAQFDNITTTALLRISYDGTRFSGWSAANDGNQKEFQQSARSFKRRKRRHTQDDPLPKGFVRSVEGVMKNNLAKIYGNIDPRRVVVEGCSRTDKGVHAVGMMAQVYCLKADVLDDRDAPFQSSIPGKRLPYPQSPHDDSHFEPLPMGGNFSRLAFALNRMRPSDIQVTGIAPVPKLKESEEGLPFHPSLSCQSKRYEYRISMGDFQDPISKGHSWYVGKSIDLSRMQEACDILVGTHNFIAFRGVPRGPEDRQKFKHDVEHKVNSNVCTLLKVELVPVEDPSPVYFIGVDPPIKNYRIIVQGDRFLYKMVRFLVGALVAVGTEKLDCIDLKRALSTGNWDIPGANPPRRREFKVAPAQGLMLAYVDYGQLELDWQPLRF